MATGQYDNAWETPGWTAQLGYYPNEPSTAVVPPAGLKNVAVTGQFFDDQARPLDGIFTFTPSVKAVRIGGSTVILRSFKARLIHGSLVDVNVISPDGTTPAYPPAWSYKIRQRVGPSISEYSLNIPSTPNTVDVYTLQTEAGPTVVTEFPIIRNFDVAAGATFRREYVWSQPTGGTNLSTWTAAMQIRTAVGGTLLLTLTNGNGITLAADGTITIELTALQTAALASGVYDLELYEPGVGGDTIRFLQGTITVNPNVTV